MRFALSDERRGFARSLDDLLGDAGVPAASRRWADGDSGPGLEIWRRLAEMGVSALRVPEAHGGLGAEPADVVVAFEALGRHLVPGPYIESVVLAPPLLASAGGGPSLDDLAAGTAIVTAAAPPMAPLALDAHVAHAVLVLDGSGLSAAERGEARTSVDRSRRLFEARPAGAPARLDPAVAAGALDAAVLACSAQLLGAGERALATAVEYAGSRRQFGRVIGEYQAVKHALADVRVALDFARPLVYGAAVSLGEGSPDAGRDVSAAKAATSEAAHLAARTALQTHGAIGYTEEYDLGLWITKIRALATAWGTPAFHRARVLAAVTAATG
ncbi:acyl-CoA dehydrogenase [Actinomadura viridis]|uniref:Alkylation response protein AidB-like acyl-CoA dehydrogenase n=1 Tax=Actinomadura viridis TaxID=58110 RepID=A0A931GII9_9ACTN|nr:acyl-CoA dehydrogenase [Actinomadura viridis]MBG6088638.1 alkylation response protein AidB-like acyl-CoA dehydrogenase [Actinomadura viridis]